MTESLALLPTDRDFAAVFGKLAIQLRAHDLDEVTIRSYFDALKDLPLAVLSASAARIAIEPGRKYFPTTGEWREIAATMQTEQRLRANAGPRTWSVECAACDDTGWEGRACPGDASCGRTTPHAAHEFVRVCPCRETNRTFMRHQGNR